MGFFARLFAPRTPRQDPPPSARWLGRNEPCWCEGGEKYKACHLEQDREYFARLKRIEDAACRGST